MVVFALSICPRVSSAAYLTSTLDTTRPIVRDNGKVVLKRPTLLWVDLLDLKVTKKRCCDLGNLQMSQVTANALVVTSAKLMETLVRIPFKVTRSRTHSRDVFVHSSPFLRVYHPAVRVELISILAEDLFVLVNHVRVDAQNHLSHSSALVSAMLQDYSRLERRFDQPQ